MICLPGKLMKRRWSAPELVPTSKYMSAQLDVGRVAKII